MKPRFSPPILILAGPVLLSALTATLMAERVGAAIPQIPLPVPPKNKRPVEREQAKEAMLDRVTNERLRNERAYEREYSKLEQSWKAKHRGKWLAVVSGKLLPRDEDGKPTPIDSAAALDAMTRARFPKARHRFMIRIGDEGKRTWNLGMTRRRFTIGRTFLKGVADSFIHAAAGGFWIVGGEKRIDVRSGDPKFDIMPTILSAEGEKNRPQRSQGMLFTNLCEGTALVGVEITKDFEVELWELPGKVHVKGLTRLGALRRVWLRFRFGGTEYDFVQHVALWPAPNPPPELPGRPTPKREDVKK